MDRLLPKRDGGPAVRPINDIVEEHTTDNQVDFEAALKAAAEEMGTPPQLDGRQAIALLDQHVEWALTYVGGLALEAVDQLGALPGGFDAAFESLQTGLGFDKFRRLYELKRISTEKRIEVPGQTSIPIPNE